jgi:hypothetical protein
MEPITLSVALGLGVLYRKWSDKHPDARKRKRTDEKFDRVLPASWEQLLEIDTLARMAADRDGRNLDHVLREYGMFTYAGGRTRTMVRKDVTRAEADKIARKIRKREGVSAPVPTDDDRERFRQGRDPLQRRSDEEDF